MHCLSCGRSQPEGSAFCGACGSALRATCPACGAPNSPDHRFCAACGAPLDAREAAGERRQLTVMFCDLADYTALSQRLDPEDLRDAVKAYQEVCGAAVAGYDGRVAQYLGDGVLAYFGFPAAHEDDARRAVKAALAILGALPDLDARLRREVPTLADESLVVRIAVHTGPVVVSEIGDRGHRELAALGPTPSLAARLQAIAERNTVVISDATRALLGDPFELEDRGWARFKGIAGPVHVHRVVRERSEDDERRAAPTLLRGRRPELERLAARWARVRERRGQVVVIGGEPGIGKSRLVRALRERLAGETSSWIECRGSPYHEHTPLHPVIELLERRLGVRQGQPASDRLTALARALDEARLSDALPFLAGLLSLPEPAEARGAPLSAEARRRRTLEALVAWLLHFGRPGPAVLVVEDLHWIDPSTRELLALVVERIGDAALLVLVTHRPGVEAPRADRPWIEAIGLGPLSPEESLQIARDVTGAGTLPPSYLEEVARRTDGVPLFVEELTKTLIEALDAPASRRGLRGEPAGPSLAIPTTLQDSLMARLDRLGPAKQLAQLASVIGREFSREILEPLAASDAAALDAALARLVEAGLVHERSGARGSFLFKHALVQETAYASLLRSRRRLIHAQVARVLEERFPERAASQPEVVARHYAESRDVERAVLYYRKAGDAAMRRSAQAEAIRHFSSAIDLVPGVVAPQQRVEWELALQIALGPPLIATRGYGSAEVERSHRRALELCLQGGGGPALHQALSGLFLFHQARAELDPAAERAAELLRLGEEAHDDFVIQWGCFFSSIPCYYRGDYRACMDLLERGLALHNPRAPVAEEYVHEHEVGVSLHCYAAMAGWSLGAADRALARIEAAVELGRRSPHPFNLAFSQSFATLVHFLRGDPQRVLESAAEAVKICTEQEFPVYLGLALMLEGWARARLGEAEHGLDTLRRGFAHAAATGTRLEAPRALGLLAEVQLLAGHDKEALEAVGTGLAIAEQKGSHFWDAELWRLRGATLLRQDPRDDAEAAHCFQRALALARAQEARVLEVRAALSEAERLRSRGDAGAAARLVEPICSGFREGLDLPELRAARALLDAAA